jgi:uroporphyrin-III C-methyltransferase
LITVAGRAALQEADVILYDRLVHPDLVEDTTAIYVGKKEGSHHLQQADINALMVKLAREGNKVVRLKGGDPFMFGRGGEEAAALTKAGVNFKIIPGVTSAIAAPSYAGIPVTHRGLSRSVTFVTAYSSGPGSPDWTALLKGSDTIVVLMGCNRLRDLAEDLMRSGAPSEHPCAVIARGTLPDQEVVVTDVGHLSELASTTSSPSLLVIGEVVHLRDELQWFESLEAETNSASA